MEPRKKELGVDLRKKRELSEYIPWAGISQNSDNWREEK